MPWSTPFYEPITLGRGRLVTLQHAADYITEAAGGRTAR
jgi:hypothetical protein